MRTQITKICCLTMLLIALCTLGVQAQTTHYDFKAGDNSGARYQVKYISEGEYVVSTWALKAKKWVPTKILKQDDYGVYFTVESGISKRVYELHVIYGQKKLVETTPENKELVYWLEN